MLRDCLQLSDFCSHFPSLGTDTLGGAQPTDEGLLSPDEMPLAGHRQPRTVVGTRAELPEGCGKPWSLGNPISKRLHF